MVVIIVSLRGLIIIEKREKNVGSEEEGKGRGALLMPYLLWTTKKRTSPTATTTTTNKKDEEDTISNAFSAGSLSRLLTTAMDV